MGAWLKDTSSFCFIFFPPNFLLQILNFFFKKKKKKKKKKGRFSHQRECKSWLDKDKKLDIMKIGIMVRLFRGPFLNGFISVTLPL